MAWSQYSQPGPSQETPQSSRRESSTSLEQTNRISIEIPEVTSTCSTPSTSRNSRPRLAPPPPPPPKKPARLIPREQPVEDNKTRIDIDPSSNDIYQQLPSPEQKSPRLPSPMAPVSDERTMPRRQIYCRTAKRVHILCLRAL
ncbi:unnamed protein product [Strongylus vulgaris]|uniref:Uncharacterized protein n=1 Tax=Strongylus vulgaris TaxID=40348 RepID=A0A3P7JNN3_STRVU|nr:unnamed protein product [Strongylus vulgaris]